MGDEKRPAHIIVVDDDPLVRDVLAEALRGKGYVVSAAESGSAAVEMAAAFNPDLVLMDIMMPPGISGIEATVRILQQNAKIRVVMCSVHESADVIATAMTAGARSYVAKGRASVAEIIDVVGKTLDGQAVLIPAPASGPRPVLPQRQREILLLTIEGKTATEIASRLSLSAKTVRNHLAEIYAKLGVSNRAQLTRVTSGMVIDGDSAARRERRGDAWSQLSDPMTEATSTDTTAPGLTPRQQEILALVAEGFTNREIAERLNLAGATVGAHLANIFSTLGAKNRVEAVRIARVVSGDGEQPGVRRSDRDGARGEVRAPVASADPDTVLSMYLGADAATALARWCNVTGRQVQVPAGAWRGVGYTGTVVAPLFTTEAGSGSRLVLAKVLPPGATTAASAHRAAVREAPPAFRPRLAELVSEPITTPGGGAIMLQALAGGSRHWRPMADLPVAQLAGACAVVTRALIADWNSDFTIQPVRDIDLLRNTVGLARSPAVVIDDPWLMLGDDEPVPNPMRLITDEHVLGDRRTDVVMGRVHGDLHAQNVLMEQTEAGVYGDAFQVVDLMTYEPSAPIDRDPVTLLLSATAGVLPELSPSQLSLLLRVFVRPEADGAPLLPFVAFAPLQAIYQTAAKLLAGPGAEVWHRQYLLSLVAHGLLFTTFTDLGATSRWWFLRLAGQAAARLLGGQPATEVVATANPFDSPERWHRAAAELARSERYRPSNRAKLLFVRRLGSDWPDLAIYLGIPAHEHARFARGDEARAIWDWLENRRLLSTLASALREIGRADLVALLDGD